MWGCRRAVPGATLSAWQALAHVSLCQALLPSPPAVYRPVGPARSLPHALHLFSLFLLAGWARSRRSSLVRRCLSLPCVCNLHSDSIQHAVLHNIPAGWTRSRPSSAPASLLSSPRRSRQAGLGCLAALVGLPGCICLAALVLPWLAELRLTRSARQQVSVCNGSGL